MDNNRIVLQAQNIKRTVIGEKGKSQDILNNINFTMEAGEFTAIMGPSGSGKSTLLYTVSGLDRASSGNIQLAEKEITKMNESELADFRLRHIGFVFQQPFLIKSLDVRDNIILSALQLEGTKKKDKVCRYAEQLMKITEIEDLSEKEVIKLSGGQAQRVGICRALINHPDIMFADEPTGALNSKSSDNIMKLFRKVNDSGTTILMVTHDSKVAANASRILFMIDGKIVDKMELGKWDEQRVSLIKRQENINNKMTAIEI